MLGSETCATSRTAEAVALSTSLPSLQSFGSAFGRKLAYNVLQKDRERLPEALWRTIRSGACSAVFATGPQDMPRRHVCVRPAHRRGHHAGVGAVDRANQVLRIIGKGDKERLVPLPQPVLDDLSWLWRTHRNRRWLFPNPRGDAPLNDRVLSRSFAIAAAAAGIRRGVTPHALRHSYATRLIMASTSASCRSCSVTPASPPLPSIPTSPRPPGRRCTVCSIGS